ncbi:GlxA family transcriptional regulator [Amycolatopsis sp. NPDC049253]|uniref:GlxA family transcriptional regulator n=1 Tax=Amycolatopsis sp. NPDC049253 TaxID=3155274 RepID=UPI0034321751
MPSPRKLVFVVFDGVKSLDVAGPAEVFAEANLFGADYALSYVSPSGAAAATSTGSTMPVDGPAESVSRADTVVVCGGDILVGAPIDPALVAAIRLLRTRTRRLVSICTGSFALATAGALSGHRATTHWRHAQLFARAFPDVDVLPDALYVEDRGVFTSAGVSAGIDLALALVEADHGPDLARAVARSLVVFMQRPGGQSQFSAPLEIKPARTPTLREVVDLISADPGLDHSADRLADRVGVSARHLIRLFQAEFDLTPARYVEKVRLDHAKSLLDSGHNIEEAAAGAGFGSPETMRRTFVARLGLSPSQYRHRFKSTGRR